MSTSGISIPYADISVAREFDRKADEFAAQAEAAPTLEDCLRYRDLEQSYRMRATEERVRHVTALYKPSLSEGAAA